MSTSVVALKSSPQESLSLPSRESEFLEDFRELLAEVSNFPIRALGGAYNPGPRCLADMSETETLPHYIYIRPLQGRHDLFQYGPKWGLFFYSSRTPSVEQFAIRRFLEEDRYERSGDHNQEGPRLSWLKQHLKGLTEALRDRREGSVRITDDTITITPSNGGIPATDLALSEDGDVSKRVERASVLAFLNQYTTKALFQWFYFQPEFYAQAVHPHLGQDAFRSPLAWAAACVEITHGHGVSCLGHDYRSLPPELAFMPLASVMGNVRNEELDRERVFARDAWSDATYRIVSAVTGDKVLPEAFLFALENRERLSHEELQSENFTTFVRALESALENGLNPDRASALFQYLHAEAPETALARATQIITDIYCQGAAPWWFRRDFAIVTPSLSGDEIHKIAAIAGSSFEETATLYAAKGKELASFAEVGEEVAIRFCSLVINYYGAGNPERARAIGQYAVDLMGQYGTNGSARGLSILEDCLMREKPTSKIIAILEGSEASFAKPGLANLREVFGLSGASKGQSFDLSATVSDLLQLEGPLALPLENRAFNPVPLTGRGERRTAGLLGTHIPLGPRELLLECNASVAPQSPAVAWHEFEQRLASEVLGSPRKQRFIAQVYLAFFAAKMPEPLSPPRGFLRFLEQYDAIRDPNVVISWPGFRSKHHLHEENNRDLLVQKFAALSAVLDAQLIGLVSPKAVSRLFGWITAPLSAERLTRIEVAESYIGMRQPAEKVAARAYRLLNRHHSIAQEVEKWERRALPRDRYFLLEADFAPEPWAAQQLTIERERLANVERDCDDEFSSHDRPLPPFESMLISPPEIDHEGVIENVRRAAGELQGTQQAYRREKFCAIAPTIYNLNLLVAAGVLDAREHRHCLDTLIEQLTVAPEHDSELMAFEEQSYESRDLCDDQPRSPNAETVQKHLDGKVLEFARCFDPAKVSSKLSASLLSWGALEGVTHAIRGSVQSIERLRDQAQSAHPENWGREIAGWEEPLLLPQRKVLAEVFPGWMHLVFLKQCAEEINAAVNTINRGLSRSNDSLAIANHALVGSFLMQRMIAEQGARDGEVAQLEEWPQVHKEGLSVLASDPKLDEFRGIVRELRRDAAALLPIGCKLHLHSKVDRRKLEALQLVAPFSFTGGFKVDNADDCIVLPAMTSARELVEVARLLVEFKIIKPEFPEYQFCIRGRLRPAQCAALGATILLSAVDNPEYSLEMFSAGNYNHETGKRMVIYDAAGPLASFPGEGGHRRSGGGDFFTFDGRTDMLGLIDISRAPTFQLIGSILSNGEYGGPLAELSIPFQADLRELLKRHGIEDILAASWVRGRDEGRDTTSDHFHRGVMPCLNAWKKALVTFEEDQASGAPNIILEMRTLVDLYGEKVRIIRDQLLSDPAFVAARKALFFE